MAAVVLSMALTAFEYWNERSDVIVVRESVRTAGVTLGGVTVVVVVDSRGALAVVSVGVVASWLSPFSVSTAMLTSASRDEATASVGSSIAAMSIAIAAIIYLRRLIVLQRYML